MDQDAAFRRTIRKDPDDDGLRLVYADWLEDRGDPRGEYIHLFHALEDLSLPDLRVEKLHARLEELQCSIDPQWFAQVMAGRVSLKYHRKTFALLNEKPVLSTENVRQIEKWEKRRKIQMPASVREWYSLKGPEEWFRPDSDDFTPLSLTNALNGIYESHHTPSVHFFPLGDIYVGMGMDFPRLALKRRQ